MPRDSSFDFLMYSTPSSVTGRRLGEVLDVQHGEEPPHDARPRNLIRWGTSQSVPYIPSEGVWNSKDASSLAVRKYRMLEVFDDAEGVPVPEFGRNPSDVPYPMLGRDDRHTQGTDIQPYLQSDDFDVYGESEHYVEYIPVQREYRFHVIDSKVVKTSWKRLECENEYDRWCRNYENGYVFVYPPDDVHERAKPLATRAIDALGLDFGAVDMILGEDDRFYVLEVNTAPSLDASFALYAEEIAEMVGVDVDEEALQEVQEEIEAE